MPQPLPHSPSHDFKAKTRSPKISLRSFNCLHLSSISVRSRWLPKTQNAFKARLQSGIDSPRGWGRYFRHNYKFYWDSNGLRTNLDTIITYFNDASQWNGATTEDFVFRGGNSPHGVVSTPSCWSSEILILH